MIDIFIKDLNFGPINLIHDVHIEYLSRFVPFKADYRDIITELQDDPDITIELEGHQDCKKLCREGKGLIILVMRVMEKHLFSRNPL